jgi:hypothetical protein
MPGNFIDARNFTFKPFPHPLHPDETGDSGALEFAVSKNDPNEQYVVKRNEYPEAACNEFMYHKVAAALGLYTQDVKLINGNKHYHRSAAIRYAPDARKFSLKESSAENFCTFFEFEALYVILNESDSHEYYLDRDGRMFKLDNAASFTVQSVTVMLFDGNPIGRFFVPDINFPLNHIEYDWYGLKYKEFLQQRGRNAADAYLSMIRKFSQLGESVFQEAYDALLKRYPKDLTRYYEEFIRIREGACRKFLEEVAAGKYAKNED